MYHVTFIDLIVMFAMLLISHQVLILQKIYHEFV